jgi:Tol biopolymer transport system component
MSLTPGARLGVYEIVGLIGAGGMGEVYRARDARLNRDVAIKVLPASFSGDAERLERFEQEARAAAALNHPNILSVFDVGAHVDGPYVVSELLEGQTLRERVSAGPIAVRKAIDYAVQLSNGLAAAHERGIVHRDLKPENIFLTADDRLKILDFGLAKLTETESTLAGASNVPTTPRLVTQPGMLLGTMGYAAPEQLRGLAADHRADLFSFGVVLYEMLSGRRAFHGPTVIDTMTAILKDVPEDLPVAQRHIPPALVRIVERCLEKNAAARFQSTRDLGFALEGLSSHSEAGITAVTVPVVRRSAWSNPHVAWLAAGVSGTGCAAAIALAALGYFSPTAADAPEMRLQIHVPDADVPGGGLTQFSLSPDGTQFVFSARGGERASDGQRASLWLRSLNSDVARPLAGTEGARNPFWSHDNRSVGFFANSQLKRVDLADGLVRTLTSAPNAAGGAWNADGTILFTKSFAGPIYKIAEGGGEAVAVTRPAPPVHSGHVFPEFLPDGRRFLFYAFGSGDGGGVYVGSLDSLDVRRVGHADAAAAFVPPDRLLLPRDGALMAQRINLASLEPIADAVTVTPSVYIDSINGKAAMSVSNVGSIAYRSSAPERELIWLNRSGARLGSAVDVGIAGAFMTLSPDGRSVAIVRRVDGNNDIWTMDLTRGALRRVTSHAAHENGPVWSPDSSQLAFGSDRKSGVLDLYVKPLNGSGETLLIESARDKTASDWSPDGKWLAYSDTDPKTGRDVWVWPLVGSQKPMVIANGSAGEMIGRFSPDGRWIVFQSDESSRFEIYAQPFPGPGHRIQISTEGGQNPQWRRDGQELFYRSQGYLLSVAIKTTPDSLTIGTPVRLFEARGGYIDPSPDGQRFLANVATESPSLVTLLVNWAGGRLR